MEKRILIPVAIIVVVLCIAAALLIEVPYAKQGSSTTTSIVSATPTPTVSTSFASTSLPTATTSTARIELVDFRGKHVVLEKPARRIVVLDSCWAEVVVALGKADTIVGIGKYVAYDQYLPKEVRSKPVVGSAFSGVNLELVASLKPDLVVMSIGYGKAEQIAEQIEKLGIPVLGLFIESFDDEIRAIQLLGKALGVEDRANELIKFLKDRYDELKKLAQTIPSDERLRVVMISGSSILRSGALTIYANTSWGRAIEDVGAINLGLQHFPDKRWPRIDFETLVSWDPDAIIVTASPSKVQKVLDAIEKDARWHVLKAYREGRIFAVPTYGYIGGVLDWGPRNIVGREYIAKMLYPRIFKDIDWRRDAEYLLTKFYGVFVPRQAFVAYALRWKEIVDPLNNTVKLPRRVERIVDLITYRTLAAFHALDRLVGVSKYAKTNPFMKLVYPRIVNVTSPGSSFSLNVEQVKALNPDVVIIWPYKSKIVEELERLGIPVVRIQLYSYRDIVRCIYTLGALLDDLQRAHEIVEDMDSIVKLVEERVSRIPIDERVKVLFLWSKPTKVQGGRGTTQDFIAMAGGINPAAEVYPTKSYVSVDFEQIVAWNPDVIVVWYYARYDINKTILNDPRWSTIKAVREGRVYREPLLEHWGPDAALLVLWMATKFYPNAFSDIDWVKIADRYYEKWYGVTYHELLKAVGG